MNDVGHVCVEEDGLSACRLLCSLDLMSGVDRDEVVSPSAV